MTGAISSSTDNPAQKTIPTTGEDRFSIERAVDNMHEPKSVNKRDSRELQSSMMVSESRPSKDFFEGKVHGSEINMGRESGLECTRQVQYEEVSQKKYGGKNEASFLQVYGGFSRKSSPSVEAKPISAAEDRNPESRQTTEAGSQRQEVAEPDVHVPLYPRKRARGAHSSAHTHTAAAAEQSIITQCDQAGDSTASLFQEPRSKPEQLRFDPVRSLANMRHEFGEHGGVNMSIEASATFTVMEPETMQKIFMGQLGPDRDFFLYSRHFNPTVLHLGKQLAAMEGTEAAYCTASGMAAIASVILQLCSTGDHVVASNRLYGGSYALLADLLPRISNITTTFVDILDHTAVESAIRPGHTKALFFETISNPTLRVADIPALSAIGHRHSLQVVADNTFAGLVVSPAVHGADIIVHSISKFISGNSDIIAGAVCGPAWLIQSLMDLHQGTLMLLGPTLNATVASVIAGRIPHLALRVREHSVRALEFAKRLHALGLKVIYPGLPDNPQHHIVSLLANKGFGYGGLLCLDLGTKERAYDLMRYLQNGTQFGFMAVSLGYHDTLMSCSGASTSSELTQEQQLTAGISPGLVRISIGYTGSLEQRWDQMLEALLALGLVPTPTGKGTEGQAGSGADPK